VHAKRVETTKLWAPAHELKSVREPLPVHTLVVKIAGHRVVADLLTSRLPDARDKIVVLGNHNDEHFVSGGKDATKKTHQCLTEVVQGASSSDAVLDPVQVALWVIQRRDGSTGPFPHEFEDCTSRLRGVSPSTLCVVKTQVVKSTTKHHFPRS